jgi:aspartate-semialdehyde dehydrogenase
MADGLYRVGIVGAASLQGKELGEELQDSLLATSDFVLFDDEEATGQVTAVADEPAFIQRIEPGSFDRLDFVFFAADAESTQLHWQAARKAGASIVDLTYGLEEERNVLIRAPFAGLAAGQTRRPNLETPAVVAAHPAAAMLALVVSRLHAQVKVETVAATLVEPASEHGRHAMDELHQQTVNLLSFQSLPREQYDAQIAFNLLPSLGAASKVQLAAVEQRIMRHYEQLVPAGAPALDLELIQAPVFHGYVASVMVELSADSTLHELQRALAGDSVDLVADDSDPPSNLSAAGQGDIMVRVRGTGAASRPGEESSAPNQPSRRFWLWLAADNLKLSALIAIACANELKRLRPQGKVQ